MSRSGRVCSQKLGEPDIYGVKTRAEGLSLSENSQDASAQMIYVERLPI